MFAIGLVLITVLASIPSRPSTSGGSTTSIRLSRSDSYWPRRGILVLWAIGLATCGLSNQAIRIGAAERLESGPYVWLYVLWIGGVAILGIALAEFARRLGLSRLMALPLVLALPVAALACGLVDSQVADAASVLLFFAMTILLPIFVGAMPPQLFAVAGPHASDEGRAAATATTKGEWPRA